MSLPTKKKHSQTKEHTKDPIGKNNQNANNQLTLNKRKPQATTIPEISVKELYLPRKTTYYK